MRLHSLLALITEIDSSTFDDFHRIAVRIVRKRQSFHVPIIDILAKAVTPWANGIASFVDIVYKKTCITFVLDLFFRNRNYRLTYSSKLTNVSKSLSSFFISIEILERFILFRTMIVSQFQYRLELILVANTCIRH